MSMKVGNAFTESEGFMESNKGLETQIVLFKDSSTPEKKANEHLFLVQFCYKHGFPSLPESQLVSALMSKLKHSHAYGAKGRARMLQHDKNSLLPSSLHLKLYPDLN